jgi:putative copper resistance protein D
MEMDMDDASLTAWLAAARAVHFASCLLIGSIWTLDVMVSARAAACWRRPARALLCIATPLALLSGAAWFILVAMDMSGLGFADALHSDALRTVWLHTRFGRAWLVHSALWVAGAAVAIVWSITRRGQWVGLLLAAGLVGGLAWSGHGNTGPAPPWHRTADVIHLLAGAVWPAGLVPFALLLRRIARCGEPDRWQQLSILTRRFSAASLSAVASLAVTGLVNSWCLVGSFAALFSTAYGRVLLVKLLLFLGMISVGAINLLVWKPQLLGGDRPARRLWRNVMVEASLGAGVVIAVGLLGLLEPGRT